MDFSNRIAEIEKRLGELQVERHRLLAEMAVLQEDEQLTITSLEPIGKPAVEKTPVTANEKVELFLKLFRARESVYPKLWENHRKGTKGYSPVCGNEWADGICDKPKIKCSDCPNQAYMKLDGEAVRKHLEGRETIGTYAIREDDTCTFLASDFDGSGWEEDVLAYKMAAKEIGVVAEIERSRSGNGAHAWIFFSEPVPAQLARQLGTVIVARASASIKTLTLETYDRFFPNQDFLPKGGYGNLIALPLQKKPRELGNSVFLDEKLSPVKDQWTALANARCLSFTDLRSVLERTIPKEQRLALIRYEDSKIALAERVLDSGRRKVKAGSYPGQIEITLGAQLKVFLTGLPQSLIAAFKRTATFANPSFFEKERMRFSTWNTPRFIFCGELQGDHLLLPRGVLDQCLDICNLAGSSVVVRDERPHHKSIRVAFNGQLLPEQKKAVSSICANEVGVLMAPPGAGKTVMACAIIGKRKTPTLVLLHRKQILDQWKVQLSNFLGIPIKEIGVVANQKRKATGRVDVGMLPTITKMEDAEEFLSQYGQIIIDECHHIPAQSFETLLKKCSAKFILGLTATPYRADGHQAIIHMQCGPIRYEMKVADGVPLRKRVIVRETSFKLSDDLGLQPPIHIVWEKLVEDQGRLELIAEDVVTAINEGRFPLIISERKQHLAGISEAITKRLENHPAKGFLFTGELGKRERARILEEITTALAKGEKSYLLATGAFIGEGFDLPALDTLFVAMPVSFKGKLVQYAGSLHRPFPGKTEVLVYDYADTSSPLTISMFRKRVHAYQKMDYKLETPPNFRWHLTSKRTNQSELFQSGRVQIKILRLSLIKGGMRPLV